MWFACFLQLAADPDQNVRSGAELLDRLMKVTILLRERAHQPYIILICAQLYSGLF